MRENWWYNMGRSASDLAYTVRSGARIQVNASDYSTSDLAYVASQGNGFIVIDDGTKPTGDIVKIARAGATIVDTGHRSPKDAALIVRASKRESGHILAHHPNLS
jgi:hypothetical protein